VRIIKRLSNEAHQLIEEFMLEANRQVALKVSKTQYPSMYRVHPEPEEAQWAQMQMALSRMPVSGSPYSQATLNEIARKAAGTPQEYMINLIILRNLNRAVYTSQVGEHFGLAFSHYTHFTSPIRRYPDLIVHRVLRALETGTPPPYPEGDLAQMARQCSERERAAEEAERESVELKRLQFYQSLLTNGETGPYKAVIVSILPKGIIAELIDTLQKGMIPFSSFTDDYYVVDASGCSARGRRNKRLFTLGDTIQVDLVKVDLARKFVDFTLVDRQPPKRKKRGRRQRRR